MHFDFTFPITLEIAPSDETKKKKKKRRRERGEQEKKNKRVGEKTEIPLILVFISPTLKILTGEEKRFDFSIFINPDIYKLLVLFILFYVCPFRFLHTLVT